MIACIRMATMGWSAISAVTEAKHFGLWTPVQEAFIADFGVQLEAKYDAQATGQALIFPDLGRYPLTRPGSALPSSEELAMTLQLASEVPPAVLPQTSM